MDLIRKSRSLYDRAVNALIHCNLVNAQTDFLAAAESYSQNIKIDSDQPELSNLNSAVCYFLSGTYGNCTKHLAQISGDRLSANCKVMMDKLYLESTKRQSPSYWETVNGDLIEMRSNNAHKHILNLLRDHPYILDSINFARQCRDSCHFLGMVDIAKSFDHDLHRLISFMID